MLYNKMQMVAQTDCMLYTPQTVEALNASYLRALALFGDIDATQSQLDEAVADLSAKKSALCFVADFSALLSAIQDVKKIDPNNYSTVSIAILKAAYDKAVSTYRNRNLKQEEVNAAQLALIEAKAALVPAGDKSTLRATLEEIATINHLIYTNESIASLHKLYVEASNMLLGRFSQTEVDEAIVALNAAKMSLEISSEREILYAYLTSIADKELLSVSAEYVEAFKLEYNNAVAILSTTSTDDEIREAKRKVEEAYNRL